MKTKIVLFTCMVMLGFVACTPKESNKAEPYTPKTLLFKVQYLQNKNGWYVTDNANKPAPINAKRTDTIQWMAIGSDVTFQFPDSLGAYFTDLDPAYSGDDYYLNVTTGKPLKLKVSDTAAIGKLVYAVLVKDSVAFAEGSSPPVIIISKN